MLVIITVITVVPVVTVVTIVTVVPVTETLKTHRDGFYLVINTVFRYIQPLQPAALYSAVTANSTVFSRYSQQHCPYTEGHVPNDIKVLRLSDRK
jgi:hypothetical protein